MLEKRSWFSVERLLLGAILCLQLVIAWGLFGPQSKLDRDAERPVVDPIKGSHNELKAGVQAARLPAREPFREMDAIFADALEDMARLRSAMHIDEGWERLGASPAMDMRDDDNNYEVSFSIPGANPGDIDVSLDGRVLTVEAASRSPYHPHIQHYKRRVLLPGPVGGVDGAYASITNGILRVHIPKGDTEASSEEPRMLF
jgi:HSP20 family molecular chaperone IbpA